MIQLSESCLLKLAVLSKSCINLFQIALLSVIVMTALEPTEAAPGALVYRLSEDPTSFTYESSPEDADGEEELMRDYNYDPSVLKDVPASR